MRWYHGTPIEFESFDPSFIGSGTDQLGSGFYFTDTFETARNYAMKTGDEVEGRVVLVVELDIANPLPLQGGFSLSQIEQIMRASPEFDDVLMNFGDVDFEGEEKVISFAVQTYKKSVDGDALTGLNALSNDFFRGHEADFLKAVNRVSGYDGVIRPAGEEVHAVVWLPERIRVAERIRLADLSHQMSPG